MVRLLSLAFVGVLVLQADVTTFSSCTAGTNTVSPCGGSLNFPGGIPNAAQAFAEASDNSIVPGIIPNLVTPITGQTLSAAALAVAYGSQSIDVSAIAQANARGTYATGGPARSGFIEFDVAIDHAHGGGATASFSDGTHTYSYNANGGGSTPPSGTCGVSGCEWTATVPFELGVPFQVSVAADVSESETAGNSFVAHGSDDATVVFELLNADRSPVPLLTNAPEPAAWTLLGLGLSIIGSAALIRNRRQRFR